MFIFMLLTPHRFTISPTLQSFWSPHRNHPNIIHIRTHFIKPRFYILYRFTIIRLNGLGVIYFRVWTWYYKYVYILCMRPLYAYNVVYNIHNAASIDLVFVHKDTRLRIYIYSFCVYNIKDTRWNKIYIRYWCLWTFHFTWNQIQQPELYTIKSICIYENISPKTMLCCT